MGWIEWNQTSERALLGIQSWCDKNQNWDCGSKNKEAEANQNLVIYEKGDEEKRRI